MGDVVHALPAVSDICRLRPDVEVHWMVESAFASIPALHPGVKRVLPMAWRKWRKSLWTAASQAAIGAFRHELRRDKYDLVLDLQGLLLKSVLWGVQARGPLVGYDRHSVREPLAALCYSRVAAVPRELQAVQRNRQLAAAHLGYAVPQAPADFGVLAPTGGWRPSAADLPAGAVAPSAADVTGLANAPFAALIPCASRPEKLWPEDHWIALGQRLRAAGLLPVVVWGSADEGQRAQRIAQGCGGVVPPLLSVAEMAGVLGRAQHVVGLDTGFTHLGAAFGCPTLGIYCDHEPGLAGITGSGPVASLGGKGQVPSREAVLAQLVAQIAARAAAWVAVHPPPQAQQRPKR